MTARIGQIGYGLGYGLDPFGNFLLGLVDGFTNNFIEGMNDGNPVLVFTTAIDPRGFEIPVSSIAGGSRAPYEFEKIASAHIGANTSELWIGRNGRGTAHNFGVQWDGWGPLTWLSSIVVEIGGATTGVVESYSVETGFNDVTSSPVTPAKNGDEVAIFFGWDGSFGSWPGVPWDYWFPPEYPYTYNPTDWFDFTFQEVFSQVGFEGTPYSAELRAPGVPWLLGGSGGIVSIAAVIEAETWNAEVAVI